MIHPDAKRIRISECSTPFDLIPDYLMWIVFVYLYASPERDNDDSLFWVDAGSSPHHYADSLRLMQTQFAAISKSTLSMYKRFVKQAQLTVSMTYSPRDFSSKARKPQWVQKNKIKASRAILSTGSGDFNRVLQNTLLSLDLSTLKSLEFFSLRTRRYEEDNSSDEGVSNVISSDDLQSCLVRHLKSVNMQKMHLTCSPYDLHVPLLSIFKNLRSLSLCFIRPLFDKQDISVQNINSNRQIIATLNKGISNMKYLTEFRLKSSFGAELHISSESLQLLFIDVANEYHFGNLQSGFGNITLCQCECPNLKKLVFYDRTGKGRIVQSLRNVKTPILEELHVEEYSFLSVTPSESNSALSSTKSLNDFTEMIRNMTKLRNLRLCLLKRHTHERVTISSRSLQMLDVRVWKYSQRIEESYEQFQFICPSLQYIYCDINRDGLKEKRPLQLFGLRLKSPIPIKTLVGDSKRSDRYENTWFVPVNLGDNPIQEIDAPGSCTLLASFYDQ